jgi:hypothetical protein
MAEPPVGAQKSFLRHLFGPAAVTAKTVCQVDQWPLPAPDNPFKSGNIAGQHFVDIVLIVACAHSGLCLKRYDTTYPRPVALFQKWTPAEENATGTAEGRSYRTKAEQP